MEITTTLNQFTLIELQSHLWTYASKRNKDILPCPFCGNHAFLKIEKCIDFSQKVEIYSDGKIIQHIGHTNPPKEHPQFLNITVQCSDCKIQTLNEGKLCNEPSNKKFSNEELDFLKEVSNRAIETWNKRI